MSWRNTLQWNTDLVEIPDITNLWYVLYYDNNEDIEMIVKGSSEKEAMSNLLKNFRKHQLCFLCPLSEKPNFVKAVFENNKGKNYDILKTINKDGYYLYDEGY